jgi:Leucine-rich repeat (LRR) protein
LFFGTALKNIYQKDSLRLRLQDNFIQDISVLKDKLKLESLFISGNMIGDVSPIRSLQNLRSLRIYDNPIDYASVMEEFKYLEYLDLRMIYE